MIRTVDTAVGCSGGFKIVYTLDGLDDGNLLGNCPPTLDKELFDAMQCHSDTYGTSLRSGFDCAHPSATADPLTPMTARDVAMSLAADPNTVSQMP